NVRRLGAAEGALEEIRLHRRTRGGGGKGAARAQMKTGLLWHERYMWHDTRSAGLFLPAGGMLEPDEHAENPRTKRRLRNLLEVSGLMEKLEPLAPRAATEADLLRFHTREY